MISFAADGGAEFGLTADGDGLALAFIAGFNAICFETHPPHAALSGTQLCVSFYYG